MSAPAPALTPEIAAQLAPYHPLAWAVHAYGWRRPRGGGPPVPRFKIGPHHRLLAQKFMEIHHGTCKRLLVSMPPRHGKTLLTARFFLGWWLATHPEDRIISVFYQEDLSRKWSRAVRDDLAVHGPRVFGLAAPPRASPKEWNLVLPPGARPEHLGDDDAGLVAGVLEGGLNAEGTGGALTGKGAHLLNCDDLVKGSAEVRNAKTRDSMWEWFLMDLLSRLEPDGAAIVTMTRWHEDDIPGRILKEQAKGRPPGGIEWEEINLPALAEEDDALGREPGEALWEERWPRERLEQMRLGYESAPHVWLSLYQGRPTQPGGSLFKAEWFSYYERTGDQLRTVDRVVSALELRVFVVVDPAFSKKQSADHTAAIAWGLHLPTRSLYALEVVRTRVDAHEFAPAIKALMSRHGASTAYVERSGFYEDEMKIVRRSLRMKEIQPNTDKVSRSRPAQRWFAQGRVHLLRGATWLEAYEEELITFPTPPDDQVDATSNGVQVAEEKLRGMGLPDVRSRAEVEEQELEDEPRRPTFARLRAPR